MGAQRAVVPDLVGLGYLAHLAGRPGTGVPAVELAAAARSVPPPRSAGINRCSTEPH